MTLSSLRIGKPPRRSRRELARRVLNQAGRYLLAYALVGWACMWLGDVHLFVPGMVIAAMACNPWRSKTSRRTAAGRPHGPARRPPSVRRVAGAVTHVRALLRDTARSLSPLTTG